MQAATCDFTCVVCRQRVAVDAADVPLRQVVARDVPGYDVGGFGVVEASCCYRLNPEAVTNVVAACNRGCLDVKDRGAASDVAREP